MGGPRRPRSDLRLRNLEQAEGPQVHIPINHICRCCHSPPPCMASCLCPNSWAPLLSAMLLTPGIWKLGSDHPISLWRPTTKCKNARALFKTLLRIKDAGGRALLPKLRALLCPGPAEPQWLESQDGPAGWTVPSALP